MRKTILVLALIICGGFSLAAQSSPDASVYVTPVTGNGSKSEDNTLFYNQLVSEITGNNFNLARAQNGADYSLIGTISRYSDGVASGAGAGQFVFHLGLRDNKTGETPVEGELLYGTFNDVIAEFPVLVTSLLYTIPTDTTGKNDEWRNKWLYFGLSARYAPRVYTWKVGSGYKNEKEFLGFGGGLSIEFHFLNFLSVETGAGVTYDSPEYLDKPYKNLTVELPLFLKYVFKPGANFMLEPYIGAHYNIPIRPIDRSYTFSPAKLTVLGGFQFGVKVGPGVLFADLRGSGDIGNAKLVAPSSVNPPPPEYHRYVGQLGLGYKYGIIQRKTK